MKSENEEAKVTPKKTTVGKNSRTNSPSGTKDTRFTAREISLILNACTHTGIKCLSASRDAFSVEFFPVNSSEGKPEPKPIEQFEANIGTSQDLPVEAVMSPQDQAAMEEFHRAQLLIDDPTDFENLMIREDLERGRANEGTNDRSTE